MRMMLIEHILEPARKRLATLRRDSLVADAAAILMNGDTPLAVVCDGDGVAVGVISRTDVVKVLVGAKADALSTCADAMMTTAVLSFGFDQPLQDVWKFMNARSLRCAPILDRDGRPQGVVHARDLATALLDDVTYEELLLRDYVLGVGYQ
jgi:CBS domain-containing protein